MISITCSPTSWMLKKWSSSSSATILRGGLHQRGVVERLEVHRQPGAHRLARLRVAEQRSAASTAMPSIVRSPPVASSMTSSSVASSPSSSSRSSSRIASATPGRFVSSCSRRSADGGEDPEPARAGREHGLHADVLAPGSRARAPRPPPRRRRARAARRGLARRSGRASRSVSALSFERRIASGEATSTAMPSRRSAPSASARPARSNDDCGSTASTPSRRQTSSIASAKPGSEPRGHDVERVAEMAPDRSARTCPCRRAGPSPLAVLAQRAQERRRAGRARDGTDEDRQLRFTRGRFGRRRAASRRRSRSASSIASIVSRIVSPG